MQRAPKLRFWQSGIVALLATGYAGFYLCRSNLSVAIPSIIAELGASGVSPDHARRALGLIVSIGTLGYALGKFAAGGIVDLLGGRRVYLLSMAGTIVCTFLFTLAGTIPLFSIAWFTNRLIQSFAWPGMIKIVSRWFSHRRYSMAMAIVSLSYLFGDAAARYFMSVLLAHGITWRGVFWVAGATLTGLWALSLVLIRESPRVLDLPEPETSTETLFGAQGSDPQVESVGPLLATFAKSRAFWMVCALSLGVTYLRETLTVWTPEYFVDALGFKDDEAARASSLFPLLGGFSVLGAGFLGDRSGRGGRAVIILIGLLLASLVLMVLGTSGRREHANLSVALVAAVGFLLIGPYSYLAGAISLDLGGKRAGATASGLIDGVGYLGGVLAGVVTAELRSHLGWGSVFWSLGAVSVVASLASAVFLVDMIQPGPESPDRDDPAPTTGALEP